MSSSGGGSAAASGPTGGFNVRDAIIFLLDWRSPMLQTDPTLVPRSMSMAPSSLAASQGPSSISLLSATLRLVVDVLKAKLSSRNPDVVGVLAFGAAGPDPVSRWPSIRTILPLARASASAITTLLDLCRRLDDHVDPPCDSLQHAADGSVAFDLALWAVRHHFTTMSASPRTIIDRKRVFVFTCDDDPARGSASVLDRSLVQVNDLSDLGATLDVTLLTTPDSFPDCSEPLDQDNPNVPSSARFFGPLLDSDDVAPLHKGVVSVCTHHVFDDILERVKRVEHNKRVVKYTTLSLSPGEHMGVALYALLRPSVRPPKVELHSVTNKPVYRLSTATCEQVGSLLKPGEIRHMFSTGFVKQEQSSARLKDSDSDDEFEDEVKNASLHGFSSEEVRKIKGIGPYGIHLYGFRPCKHLKPEHTLGPPTFMFPYDGKYSGSSKLFATLHASMLRRDVFGIVSVRTGMSGMRFSALVAQEAGEDDCTPGGMQLYSLPYRNDVYKKWREEVGTMKEEGREVVEEDEEENAEAAYEESEERDREAVMLARGILKKLKLAEFSSDTFANPDLERFQAGLMLAAGVESGYAPEDEDLTPKTEEMSERAGAEVQRLGMMECGEGYDGEAVAARFGTKGAKRTIETQKRAEEREKIRKEREEEARGQVDVDMFRERVDQGTLGNLLVKDLKMYCRAHGLGETGRKRTLEMKVEDHVRKRERRG